MPKDDWAKYSRRDRGRAAIAQREFDRVESRAHRRPVKKAPKKKFSRVLCPRCHKPATDRSWRTFADGSTHVEIRCAGCDRFVKWGR